MIKGLTCYTHFRGHHIHSYDGINWVLTEEDVPLTEEVKDRLKCPRCGNGPTPEGHDHCLKTLPGIRNACCGHGVEVGYIQFENGVTIRGRFTVG